METTCFINAKEKLLLIREEDGKGGARQIRLDADSYSPDELALISKCNRHFLASIYQTGLLDKSRMDGCLPKACLEINSAGVISPKYLINCFIHTVQLLLRDEIGDKCARDVNTVAIPTTPEKITNLYSTMLQNVEQHQEQSEPGEEDLSALLKMVMGYMAELQNQTNKKLEKGKKNLSMVGGVNHNMFMDKENMVQDMMGNCVEIINAAFEQHRLAIIAMVMGYGEANPKIADVIGRVVEDDKPIYANTQISLNAMMSFLGEVFNALFFKILPSTSMTVSMQAVIYHMATLNELNLLEDFSHTVHLPIIYRLVHSCFEDQGPCDIEAVSKYLSAEHSGIYNSLSHLCDTTDPSNRLAYLCEVAVACNVTDEKLTAAIYWYLNARRKYTIEFYLITLVSVYTQNKCAGLNKLNKKCNAVAFARPLHTILLLFRDHVREFGLDLALCDHTLVSFTQKYGKELKSCVQQFSVSALKNQRR